MKEFWNDRYGAPEFAYGTQPNAFLKSKLENLSAGKILFPAEGEGRNAVFAAECGWEVQAFDISESGKIKAENLALQRKVSISYSVSDIELVSYKTESFDAIALIYAHFPQQMRTKYHQKLTTFLRPDGYIVLEAFSKNNLQYLEKNPKIGGPKNPEQLFSTDEIAADFPNFEILELEETIVNLQEGLYHNGTGSVIRFVGRKK